MLLPVRLPPRAAADAIRRAWDAGSPVLPLDPEAPETETGRLLGRLQSDAPVDPEVAAVVATSGTEGEPKGVELTWAGLRAAAEAVSSALDVGADDGWLCSLPVHRVAGLAIVARSWATGTPVTFDDDDDEREHASLVSMVPTQVRRLLQRGADVTRFRRILVGGGPIPDDVAALPNVVTTYGMTETWGGVVHDGHPLPGVEVDLAADGEILLRTPSVMRGYRVDPAATAAAFTDDGWLRTGDVGEWSPEGRLRVVDRRRDIVITGGVNVSPTEVEAVLASHPGIADVAVAGAPDDEWGERVVAYVVPRDPARPPTLDALRAHSRATLAAPKLPREVVLVPDIPRSPTGKPLRRLLSPPARG